MQPQEEKLARVRIGTAGWVYDDWRNIVYADADKTHPLALLSRYFDTVEVNATFYRPMSVRTAAGWLAHVAGNPDFTFLVKLWQRFTHERATFPTQDELRLVMEPLRPLREAGRLGAVLAQFPWSFKRTREARSWLAQLTDTLEGLPLSFEFRHASWLNDDTAGSLAQRGIAFCNIDQPVIKDNLPVSALVTTPKMAYIRLHGRNAEHWFKEGAGRNARYNYLYSPEELKPWVDRVESMRKLVDELYVVTNNHYEGKAVVNALEISQSLGRPLPPLPRSLVEHYPHLKKMGMSVAAPNGLFENEG
jgi:uncharacterized protein YecE (DUF72 family)